MASLAMPVVTTHLASVQTMPPLLLVTPILHLVHLRPQVQHNRAPYLARKRHLLQVVSPLAQVLILSHLNKLLVDCLVTRLQTTATLILDLVN